VNGRADLLRAILLVTAAGAASALRSEDAGEAPKPDEIEKRAKARRAIEETIDREWKAGAFPSLSVGIVSWDGLVLAKSAGFSDRRTSKPAAPGTLYRIGSVTKPFTATLLLILRDQGKLRLDDPVALYLPAGVKLPGDPRGSPAITLRHLATHGSGLPRIPVDLKPRGGDLYGGYTLESLLEGLSRTELDAPIGSRYSYSNLGYGILGAALEHAAGDRYEDLLRKLILEPLGMRRTGVTVDEAMEDLLAVGYEKGDTEKEAPTWDLGCLAPGGGLISSVEDLAAFVALELRAERKGGGPITRGTLLESQIVQRVAEDWSVGVGLGWHVRRDDDGAVNFHSGEVAGFYSFVAFVPRTGVGVIALTNCGKPLDAIGRRLLSEATSAFGAEAVGDVGPRVLEVAEGLRGCFVKDASGGLRRWLSDEFIAQIPVEKVAPLFQGPFESFGPCEGFDARPSRGPEANPRRARIAFRFAKGRTVECDLEVGPLDPPRVVYLYFR
jgi:CubicO group peptidase (beta-lactamase class C family)